MSVILKADIKRKLKEIGLESGDNVIVHTSLKSMGYVCGGAQAVIEALIETVGENGTIMMPTQSWKNLDPETGVHGEVDEKDWPLIRENWPAYDKKMTPTNTMGAVAEMFRQWPGSVRSDHPARSICAWGKNAAYLTQNHDLSDIFGESSPLAKLYPLGSPVDVWYNPDKPKEAFVQRFEGVNRLLLVLFTGFGVFTTGLVLFFLLGPEIVMQ